MCCVRIYHRSWLAIMQTAVVLTLALLTACNLPLSKTAVTEEPATPESLLSETETLEDEPTATRTTRPVTRQPATPTRTPRPDLTSTRRPTLPPTASPTLTPPSISLQDELAFGIGGGSSYIGCQTCCLRDSSISEPTVVFESGDPLQGFLCMQGYPDRATFDIDLYAPDKSFVDTITVSGRANASVANWALVRKWVGLPSGVWSVTVTPRSRRVLGLPIIDQSFTLEIEPFWSGYPRIDIYEAPYGNVSPFFEGGDCQEFDLSSQTTVAGTGFMPQSVLLLGVYRIINDVSGSLVYQSEILTNVKGEFLALLAMDELDGSGRYAFGVADVTHAALIDQIAPPNCFVIP